MALLTLTNAHLAFGHVALLDGHVFEFAGFEDLAALYTFNVFGVFFTGDNLYAGMLTHMPFNLRSLRPRGSLRLD